MRHPPPGHSRGRTMLEPPATEVLEGQSGDGVGRAKLRAERAVCPGHRCRRDGRTRGCALFPHPSGCTVFFWFAPRCIVMSAAYAHVRARTRTGTYLHTGMHHAAALQCVALAKGGINPLTASRCTRSAKHQGGLCAAVKERMLRQHFFSRGFIFHGAI